MVDGKSAKSKGKSKSKIKSSKKSKSQGSKLQASPSQTKKSQSSVGDKAGDSNFTGGHCKTCSMIYGSSTRCAFDMSDEKIEIDVNSDLMDDMSAMNKTPEPPPEFEVTRNMNAKNVMAKKQNSVSLSMLASSVKSLYNSVVTKLSKSKSKKSKKKRSSSNLKCSKIKKSSKKKSKSKSRSKGKLNSKSMNSRKTTKSKSKSKSKTKKIKM